MQLRKQQARMKRFASVTHTDIKKADTWWPKTFAIYRSKDYKNISGKGYAIHGVVFRNGKTVIYWSSTDSISIFDSFDKFSDTHLKGSTHGDSEVLWLKTDDSESAVNVEEKEDDNEQLSTGWLKFWR